jgi:adenine phosphoribosyltransferase
LIFRISEEGILFKDITPLLIDRKPQKVNPGFIAEDKIDKVIGVESRFFLRMLIAQRLNVGFVPVRKPNKLCDTISASYELEYGTDTLEIHTDAIRKGDRVLIHDDVSQLEEPRKRYAIVEELGGEIVQLNFLEISFLNGREKIKDMRFFGDDLWVVT